MKRIEYTNVYTVYILYILLLEMLRSSEFSSDPISPLWWIAGTLLCVLAVWAVNRLHRIPTSANTIVIYTPRLAPCENGMDMDSIHLDIHFTHERADIKKNL